MENIIGKLIQLTPYPYFDNRGKATNGAIVKVPDICVKCNKKCLVTIKRTAQKIIKCNSGFNVYRADIHSENVIIFGLLIKGQLGKLPRKQKKALNDLTIELSDLRTWEKNTTELIKEVVEFKDRKIKDNFSLFHDIIPTISLIFRTVEAMINNVEGENFEAKVENADYRLKTLYHSIDLLDNRLKIMPLIGNPESAKFGQVTKCSPYKVFDKVCRIFSITASSKGIKLNLDSNKYITVEPLVYDSFMTLPFLLIENAIKYSVKNKTVDIYFYQNHKSVTISVSSYGPIVKDENIHRIFDKGFKDPNAQMFSSKGSGIGLFLADIVAKAHNIDILYSCEKKEINDKNIELGINKFSIVLNR